MTERLEARGELRISDFRLAFAQVRERCDTDVPLVSGFRQGHHELVEWKPPVWNEIPSIAVIPPAAAPNPRLEAASLRLPAPENN